MFFRRLGLVGITFLAAWVISFSLSYWVFRSTFWEDAVKKPLDEQNLEMSRTQAVGVIPENTIIKEEIYYTLCRHLKTREILAGELFSDLSDQAIKNQGWAVFHNRDGSITISKNVDGLCPDDSNKRHLGVSGEFVAVFEGPIGVPGKLLEVLNIRVAKLPKEWQEKVRKGEMDFSSEQELLEALDSIDEYE